MTGQEISPIETLVVEFKEKAVTSVVHLWSFLIFGGLFQAWLWWCFMDASWIGDNILFVPKCTALQSEA